MPVIVAQKKKKREVIAMKYIDLHVHSNVSDGTFTPEQLVEEAISSHLSAFALTDHDTVKGIPQALAAAKKATEQGTPIEVIPGVEISAAYKKKDIHILGLLINPQDSALNQALEKAIENRENRNKKMAENLAKKASLSISYEDLCKAFAPGTVLTRAHFAKYLVETKQIKSMDDAFQQYLHADGPYYVPREYISPKDAIALIRQAGGIPILAHPLLYHLPEDELLNLISQLKSYGLLGLEVIYSANIGFDEGILRRYANQFDLCMSGGSDFHGSNKPHIALGRGKGNLKIPYSLLEQLQALLPV